MLRLILSFPLLRIGLLSCLLYALLVIAAATVWAVALRRTGDILIRFSHSGVVIALGLFWFAAANAAWLLAAPRR